jgi:hypothetical protein
VSRAVVWGCAVLLATGCADEASPDGGAIPVPTTEATVVATPDDVGTSIAVPSLGVAFRLPPSLAVADDPDLVFLARSSQPQAVISIAAEPSDIVQHEPEGGETVSPATIATVEAVVVENAAVDGLPAGVVANELLVANGTRSFSLIMSSGQSDLPVLWDDLLASISVG